MLTHFHPSSRLARHCHELLQVCKVFGLVHVHVYAEADIACERLLATSVSLSLSGLLLDVSHLAKEVTLLDSEISRNSSRSNRRLLRCGECGMERRLLGHVRIRRSL